MPGKPIAIAMLFGLGACGPTLGPSTEGSTGADTGSTSSPDDTSIGNSGSGSEGGSEGGPGSTEAPTPPPLDIQMACSGSGSSLYDAMMWEAPELHVYGVYESSSNHAITTPSSVSVDRGTNVVLVLSSYESTEWTVTAAPGTTIDRVILNGYENHLVNVPPGVLVDDYSGMENHVVAAAFQYGDPETTQLINWAETQTGLMLTSFSGCYQSAQLSLGQP